MEKFLDFIVRAGSLDRRYIFIVIALVVILPLFFPLGLPIRPTSSSQDVYNTVEKLEAGDKALVSFEYGPSPPSSSVSKRCQGVHHLLVA